MQEITGGHIVLEAPTEVIRKKLISLEAMEIKVVDGKEIWKANTCEWCGEHTTGVVMHQVRTLKDLDRTLPWNQHMIKINRKTLVVCSDCHKKIHLYEN